MFDSADIRALFGIVIFLAAALTNVISVSAGVFSLELQLSKKVIVMGEEVVVQAVFGSPDASVSAMLISPDGIVSRLSLPARLNPADEGIYVINATAKNAVHDTAYASEMFGVIKRVPVVKDVGICLSDGVCNGEEDIRNCPHDCTMQYLKSEKERQSVLYSFFIIFIFSFMFCCFFYFEYLRFKHYREQDLELKNYVLSVISRGFSEEQVSKEMKASGWPNSVINKVFQELSKYNLPEIREDALREKELQLKRYVFNMMRNGVGEKEIREDLRRSGWSDKVITKVFWEMRVYFFKKGKSGTASQEDVFPMHELPSKPERIGRAPRRK